MRGYPAPGAVAPDDRETARSRNPWPAGRVARPRSGRSWLWLLPTSHVRVWRPNRATAGTARSDSCRPKKRCPATGQPEHEYGRGNQYEAGRGPEHPTRFAFVPQDDSLQARLLHLTVRRSFSFHPIRAGGLPSDNGKAEALLTLFSATTTMERVGTQYSERRRRKECGYRPTAGQPCGSRALPSDRDIKTVPDRGRPATSKPVSRVRSGRW
jgi:hypothetical protein